MLDMSWEFNSFGDYVSPYGYTLCFDRYGWHPYLNGFYIGRGDGYSHQDCKEFCEKDLLKI